MSDLEVKTRDIVLDVIFILGATAVLVGGIIYSRGSMSSVGLTLDVSGFIILFGFAPPLRGATIWDFPPKRKYLVTTMSWVGASLVLAGFVMQYLASIGISF